MKFTRKDRLLVISPHPDDEALGVGGLIGKFLKIQAKIYLVYVCVGSSRQLVTKSTNKNIRLQEIEKVKKLTGAKIDIFYIGKEFTRLDVVPQKDLIEKIEDVINVFKPTIITIPSSSSYNQDHRETYNACITALRPTPQKVSHFIPCVLEYFEPYFWTAYPAKEPNVYLNLDEQYRSGNLLDFKINLYKCHATQVRENPFPRSIENLIHLAHIYGKEIGVDIAEPYHQLRNVLC